MINLIWKDFSVTKRQILIAVAYCIAVPMILVLDGSTDFYLATVFIPFVATSLPIAKICSVEDVPDIRIMLKRLPYRVATRVAARFIFALILLSSSLVYLSFIQIWLFRYNNTIKAISDNIVLLFLFGTYYGLYLALFFWKGSVVAQYSVYVIFAIYFVVSLIVNKLNGHQTMGYIFQMVLSNKLLLIPICLGVISFFYIASIYCDRKRELI